MSIRTLFMSLVVLAVGGFSPAAVRAQFGADRGKVSGTGTETIKRAPDALRMQVVMLAQGKDVKDALGKLKARGEAAKAKLVEMGADAATIQIGEPRVPPEDSSRRQQMEMRVRQRLRQQGKAAPKKEETKPVGLGIELEAEWPLKAADSEAMFAKAYDLQQKISAEMAKLRGSEELSPEEEEMAEEMQGMSYDSSERKPGEPSFLYLARISKDDVSKAMASAFKKAQTQAEELSQAAGAKLGALEHVASHESIGSEDDPYGNMYRSNPMFYRAMIQQQRSPGKAKDGPAQAVGPDPGAVSLSVTVVASFGFKD